MRQTTMTRDALVPAGARATPTMTRWERQRVFREMVTAMANGNGLTAWKRAQLIRYAASLGLDPVQAGRLVAQARASAASRLPAAVAPGLACVGVRPLSALQDWDVGTDVILVTVLLNVWILLSVLL